MADDDNKQDQIALTPKKPTRIAVKKLDARGHPPKAIRWKTKKQRTRLLNLWRAAIMRRYSTQPRPLKVAWALEGLVAGVGFCFAGNDYLAAQTGFTAKRMDEILRDLERDGAIIRTNVSTQKGRARRIYLCTDILIANPPKTGGLQNGSHSPRGGGSAKASRNPPTAGCFDPPTVGGSEAIKDAETPSRPSNAGVAADGGARLRARAPLPDDGSAS